MPDTQVANNNKDSEWLCKVSHPTWYVTDHFRDESFQAIDCTATDKETEHYMHPKHKTEIPATDNRTIYTLIKEWVSM